jgi:outer membrane receptor protein involved in Fe transport
MFQRMGRFFTITFVFLLTFVANVHAQNTASVNGTIIDSASKKPLDYASIAIIRQADNKTVEGMQTDATGKFQFSSIAPGTYIVRVGFVGYRRYERRNITLTAGQQLNLGILSLRTSGNQVLKEVEITAAAPGMVVGIDRKVFNVEQSLISQGGSVTDLLSDVPSLSVDADGTVSLRGSSSVRILIDGKPSAMAGSDITQVLQSLPANSVQRIEVITNPSAKYEAEGQSGIINIVLKKNIRTGLNGVATASAGTYHNYNGGLSLNYRDSSFNYYGNYDFRRFRRVGNGNSLTRYSDTNGIIDNNSESDRSGLGHSAKLGIDYFINQTTTIGISGNFSIRDNERNEDIFYRYENLPELNGTSTRYSRQTEDDTGYDLNLDFKKEFKRVGEELTFNAAYGRNKEDGVQTFDQMFSNALTPADRRINNTYEMGDNTNIQLDYVLPFNDFSKLEAGYRTTLETNEESQLSTRFDPLTNNFGTDYNVSNKFNLQEDVHAIYANYQNRFTKTLGYQVGFRAEQAYLNTITTALDPAIPEEQRATPGRLAYFRVYPSIFLTQKFSENQQLQLSYSRRVNRPNGWQVNPFIDVSDPLNIRQGNPNLRPEDIHSFELGYSNSLGKTSITSSIYHRRVNEVIQMITQRVDSASSATISQWNNISRNESTGFELISKTKLGPGIDITGNANIYYNRFKGSPEFNIEERDGINWDANLSTNINLIKNLTAQVRGNYNAPRVQAQGKSIAMFVVDAALRLSMFENKGSLLLNVRDVFNQRRWGGYTQTSQFTRNFESRGALRTGMISFSYRFGSSDRREEKQERDESEDNNEPQGQ